METRLTAILNIVWEKIKSCLDIKKSEASVTNRRDSTLASYHKPNIRHTTRYHINKFSNITVSLS